MIHKKLIPYLKFDCKVNNFGKIMDIHHTYIIKYLKKTFFLQLIRLN